MTDLLIAALFFVGTHIGIPSTQLRPQIIDRVGEPVYRVLYSTISLVAIIWMVMALNRAPYIPLVADTPGLTLVPLVVMPFAFLLLVGGVSGPNPTAMGQTPDPDTAEPARGMLRVTRHPVMWAIALWALAHLLANLDQASLIFFGAFAVLALLGAHMQDLRRTRESPPGWGIFLQSTSFVPLAAVIEGRQRLVWSEIGWTKLVIALALDVLLIIAHPWLFGAPAIY